MPSTTSPQRGPRRFWRRALRFGAIVFFGLCTVGFVATRVLIGRAEGEHPPDGDRVLVAGLSQRVLLRGPVDGTPIVFVHGAFGGADDFEATLLDALGANYRCVAWDRPGHGYSERPEGSPLDPAGQARILLQVIESLELERPMLVGFSFGASVVLAAALAQPDSIRGVVTINGLTRSWDAPIKPAYRIPAIPLVGWLLTEVAITPLGHLLSGPGRASAFAPEAVSPSFERSPLGLALRPHSYRANSDDVRLVKPFLAAQSQRYGELRCPLTIMLSLDDHIVSPEHHSRALAALAPDARIVEVAGAGHQLHYARPQIVIRTIEDAMRRAQ